MDDKGKVMAKSDFGIWHWYVKLHIYETSRSSETLTCFGLSELL